MNSSGVVMRALIIIAVSAAGLVAGAAAVSAADLKVETSGYHGCCNVEYGLRQVVILDNEPGVTIRRWWLPPWRNRHYYPHGRWAAKKTSAGEAVERESAVRQRPRQARSFQRYWSNSGVYASEPELLSADTPLPPTNPYRYMPPVVVAPTVR
jgi:hypothetical protein